MKNLVRSVVLLASVFAASIQAATVYNVSDAANPSCGGHGLWTGDDFSGCSNNFSIQAGSTLTVDKTPTTGSAVLAATAKNSEGLIAIINIVFSDYADDKGAKGYKQEGGLAYNTINVDFFQSILGTITIGKETYDIDAFRAYQFQFGLGASAKTETAFGASAWIKSCQNGVDGACMSSDHWDLNLNLTPTPIPGALVLFGIGLAGLGVVRKRSAKA